jgi:RimJ/RimL family protein N-acetyltransferase
MSQINKVVYSDIIDSNDYKLLKENFKRFNISEGTFFERYKKAFKFSLIVDDALVAVVYLKEHQNNYYVSYIISLIRCKGYGKMLLSDVIKECTKKPIFAIIAEDNHASIKMFESLGFFRIIIDQTEYKDGIPKNYYAYIHKT